MEKNSLIRLPHSPRKPPPPPNFCSLLTKSQFPPPPLPPTKLTFSSYNPIKTSFLAVATTVPFLF